MKELQVSKFPQFYLTNLAPCPYRPGQVERKVFTSLTADSASALNNALTHVGFRRSQNIAYKPSCPDCSACISVRVNTENFDFSKSFKRILLRNSNIRSQVVAPKATDEQFALLRGYLDARHDDGGMADMTVLDYVSMIEDSPIETHLVEYRLDPTTDNETGELIGVALTDVLADGLSMVYSFYNCHLTSSSLGTHMILDHVNRSRDQGLRYIYLGYWIADCQKMAYKARFRPLEKLGSDGWEPYDAG